MSSAFRSARFARAGALLLLVASLLSPHVAHAEIHGAFAHGVASGDPTSESVIIWTRVTPVGRDQPGDRDPTFDDAFEVTWTVATKPPWRSPREGAGAFLPEERSSAGDGRSSDVGGGSYPFASEDAFDFGWFEGSVEKTGVVTATAARDWTVKVDVSGLASNVRYYYAFEVGASARYRINAGATSRRNARSPTGTFALPPPPRDAVPRVAEVGAAEVRRFFVRELGVRAFPRVRRRAQRLGRRTRRVAPSRRLLLRVRRKQLPVVRGSRPGALARRAAEKRNVDLGGLPRATRAVPQ
jgi:hypothetical protein